MQLAEARSTEQRHSAARAYLDSDIALQTVAPALDDLPKGALPEQAAYLVPEQCMLMSFL